MIVILCLIILFLSSVILFSTKTILKQKKLILSYDNCLKKQGNMQRLIHLAKLAEVKGHYVQIKYSTKYDVYHILFYVNGKLEYEPYSKKITDDESFEAVIKQLERLIK